MAELVGVYAASHAPLLVRAFDAASKEAGAASLAAYREIGRRMAAARPDILVVVSPDHWVNFFINNLPSICVAAGDEHVGPPEPWMKGFPYRTLRGHPAFANHLLQTAFEHDFEPSTSHRLELDHGICIPLWKMELPQAPALVPVIMNTVEPPMMSVRRCFAWGDLIAKAVRSFPGDARVAVLATGGLSHSIGERDMGRIDEPFDLECMEHFAKSDRATLMKFLDARMEAAGNGAAETRNWVVAHAAAGERGFEKILYYPIPQWYVGCGWAAWNLGTH